MEIVLRRLNADDVATHNAGEDEETIRWLSGGRSTAETTIRHFRRLADNARLGTGTQGFGVCLDGRLAGYVEADPDVRDGLAPGDVNVSYAVHSWARGQGVAVEAVRLICDYIRDHRLGSRPAIRVAPANRPSVRVAEKSGFRHVRDFVSRTDKHPDGTFLTMCLYLPGQ